LIISSSVFLFVSRFLAEGACLTLAPFSNCRLGVLAGVFKAAKDLLAEEKGKIEFAVSQRKSVAKPQDAKHLFLARNQSDKILGLEVYDKLVDATVGYVLVLLHNRAYPMESGLVEKTRLAVVK